MTNRGQKTTPARPHKDTVANPPPPEPVSKGHCDNHPDRDAVYVTDFPWAQPQRFCAQCIPEQYKSLMQ